MNVTPVVAEELNHSNSPAARNPTSPRTTHWEEWKIHLHERPLVQCARLEEGVTTACLRVLDGLPDDERRTLWLASDSADSEKSDPFGKTRSSEIVADLYERVEDLAREQAKEEASFGRGFFQRRDELLPAVREILEALSRRGQFDSETTALLQQFKTTIDSMPEQEPSEFIKVNVVLYGQRRGFRRQSHISVLVSPESFELDLGGHEWTKEIGGDSWSGRAFNCRSRWWLLGERRHRRTAARDAGFGGRF